MQDRLEGIARVLGAVARIALWLSGIGLVAMTAAVAWQVFGRYVLNRSPSWTEATSVLLMGWFIFLGASVGIREGYHLSFDVLLHVLPERAGRVLHTLSDLVVIAFGIGMAIYGGQLAYGTWDATMPALGIPTGVSYLPVVVGGLLIILFSLERIARRFAGLETARFGEVELPQD